MVSALDELVLSERVTGRPWGVMRWLDAPSLDLTVKCIKAFPGERTSLQVHDRKDELLLLLEGEGYAEVGGRRFSAGSLVRVYPGTEHRVTGPLIYVEVSTYDDGTDTVRLADDYGRSE